MGLGLKTMLEWWDAVEEGVAVEPSGEFPGMTTISWRWSEIECPKCRKSWHGPETCKAKLKEYDLTWEDGSLEMRLMRCDTCSRWMGRPLGLVR